MLAERIQLACGATQVTLGRRLQRLWGGYGELWRAEVTLESEPTPVVVKLVQPPAGQHDHAHRRKLNSYAVEQAFYAGFAARCLTSPVCRVPRAHGLLSDEAGWLFVLEDLNASGYDLRQRRVSTEQIVLTLRWLADFHARFLGTAPEQLWPTGTYWHLATRPDELAATPDAALRRTAPQIDRALEAARFKTLVHGDAKLENVCFSATEAGVALVDFQYVGGGVGVKDVAYFLSSCVPPEDCAARVPGLLDRYFRELRRAASELGSSLDADALEHEWRALFPLAWVDYYRFLLGWTRGQQEREPYSERLKQEVLARLTSA